MLKQRGAIQFICKWGQKKHTKLLTIIINSEDISSLSQLKQTIHCSNLFLKMPHCVRHFVSILRWCVKGQFAIANLCCFKIFTNNQPIKVSDMYMKHALRKLRKNFTIAWWLGLWTLQRGKNIFKVNYYHATILHKITGKTGDVTMVTPNFSDIFKVI